jgi:glycosyltransferase involved in cell wall biosynthesis
LRDEERRISMGLKARDRVVKLFSWDKAAEQTLRVYREVIS